LKQVIWQQWLKKYKPFFFGATKGGPGWIRAGDGRLIRVAYLKLKELNMY